MADLHLVLTRDLESDTCIHGRLAVNGLEFCYTLERPRAGIHPCIPEGTYKVILDHSNRFGRILPHVLSVPGREGIRMHPGNLPSDSEGCILVGEFRGQDAVLQSQAAMRRLMAVLKEADSITLTVRKVEALRKAAA